MLRILFLDNEKKDAEIFRAQTEKYFSEKAVSYEFVSYDNPGQFFEAQNFQHADIAIINLSPENADGIVVSKKLYAEDKACIIGFLANSPDFALEGYGVNAVSYSLKPVTQDLVFDLLNKCMTRYLENFDDFVVFKANSVYKKVQLSKIIYLESKNKSVNLICSDESLVIKAKMDDVMEKLPVIFVRVHKSFAVNLQYVTAIRSDHAITHNGKNIPVSRRFSKSAYEQFVKMSFNEIRA